MTPSYDTENNSLITLLIYYNSIIIGQAFSGVNTVDFWHQYNTKKHQNNSDHILI